MPVATLIGYDVTSVAKAQAAALEFAVQSVSAIGAADILQHSLALSAPAFLGETIRQLGIGIDLDRGDGALSRLLRSELGPRVSVVGSLDGYSRTFSFARSNIAQSPFLFSLLRSLRQVKATGYAGVPGNVENWQVFSGYLRAGEFGVYSDSAQVECQDLSIKFNAIPLAYNLAPGSARTRLSVLLEILNQYGVPYGEIDLGPADGGVLFKPISVGGDVGLLDWIRDFLTPIGRRLYFRPDGKMEVRRFDISGRPVQRTLKAADLGSLSVRPPATNEPTSVSTTGTLYSYISETGLRTTVRFFALDFGGSTPVTIQAATSKQDHTTGTISPITPPANLPAPGGAVRITSVFSGATLIAQHIETYGYYSARACPKQQAAGTGAISYNASFDVYQYPDGSWHVDPVEVFQKTRDVVIARTFTASGVLVSERKDVVRFVPIEMPISSLDSSANETPLAAFMTDDGRSWWAGREIFELAIGDTSYESRTRLSTGTETVFSYFGSDTSKRLIRTQVAEYIQGTYSYKIISKPGSPLANPGNYGVFGPLASKRYGVQVGANAGYILYGPNWLITNQAIDEKSYRQTIALGTTIPAVEFDRMNPAPVPGATIIAGAIPYVDVVTNLQQPGPNTQKVTDEVRAALSQSIPTYQQNDFCEDAGELRTASIERIRQLSAWQVPAEIPLDWTLNEGDVLAISLPGVTDVAKNCLLWGLEHSLDCSTGDGRTRLSLLYWPTEIVTN